MNFDDCVNFFVDNASKQKKLGFEYETIPVNVDKPERIVMYNEQNGLYSILNALQSYGYSPIVVNKFLAGVADSKTKITLEPGGQIEFSCDPENSVTEISRYLDKFLSDMRTVCGKKLSLHSIGYHPFCSADEVPVIPCPRYQNITALLHGCSNQKLTASMQCSLDYSSRIDTGKKIKLACLIQPYLIGFFGNSCFYRGEYSGFNSYRTKCLREFDKDRSGTPDFIWSDDFFSSAYELYTEWAFQKELFYIIRNNEVIGMNGINFQDYLERNDKETSLCDWTSHLSTLYPDARLKNVIELRACDTCPPTQAMMFLSLIKGLMYCDDVLNESLYLTRKITRKNVEQNYQAIAQKGLLAVDHAGKDVRKVLQEFVGLALRGLEKIGQDDEKARLCSLGKSLLRHDLTVVWDSCKIV